MTIEGAARMAAPLRFSECLMRKFVVLTSLLVTVGMLGGCAVYVPDAPYVTVKPQGGPGNGFCPPGQGKKGNC